MYINVFLLTLSFVIGAGILLLFFILKKKYQYSLTSVEIKEKGFLYFIKLNLDSIFKLKSSKNKDLVFICWLFFILLHLFVPFFLASFILKNDWNVLIAIFSIIVSMNLFQKIYPSDLYFDKKENQRNKKT